MALQNAFGGSSAHTPATAPQEKGSPRRQMQGGREVLDADSLTSPKLVSSSDQATKRYRKQRLAAASSGPRT